MGRCKPKFATSGQARIWMIRARWSKIARSALIETCASSSAPQKSWLEDSEDRSTLRDDKSRRRAWEVGYLFSRAWRGGFSQIWYNLRLAKIGSKSSKSILGSMLVLSWINAPKEGERDTLKSRAKTGSCCARERFLLSALACCLFVVISGPSKLQCCLNGYCARKAPETRSRF